MNKQKSAISDIAKHLQKGRKLTTLQAIERFGCTRLAAVIFDLKAQGMDIVSKPKKVVTRYGKTVILAEYSLTNVSKK